MDSLTPPVSCDSTDPARNEALVRDMLVRMADRWTLLVIEALEGQPAVRFTRLREAVDGVSQKMLTKTLRQLERDGLVRRTVHPVVPPHVEYRLTELGEALGAALCPLWTWAEANVARVEAARRAFDTAALHEHPR